jgi:hypothetical protein
VVDRLASERWVPGQRGRLDAIVASARKHRDAALPEIALFGLALTASQLVVWGGLPFGARRLTMAHHLVLARGWYSLIALPLFQFLVYRALWRWAIWTQMLWRLSRLRLQPLATHPDQAGGLEFLSLPSLGFAYVVAALSATQAGVWADQVLHAGVKVTDLKWEALSFVVAAVVVALGPLLVMSIHLWRCQFEGRHQYGDLATDYARQFHARWMQARERSDLLGTADIQSLADLANGYAVVDGTRMVPFGPRAVFAIVAAALAPMLPVALLGVPLPELLAKLAGAFLGKPG